jgi:hypothetical protein
MDSVAFIAAVRSQPIAFLFAHYDDAVLSASLLMSEAGPGSIDMVVCSAPPPPTSLGMTVEINPPAQSSGSPPLRALRRRLRRKQTDSWDSKCGFDNPQVAVGARRVEHQSACDALTIETADLQGMDSQYGSMSREQLRRCEDLANEHIQRRKPRFLVSHPRTSDHPDHKLAAGIAERVSRELQLDLLVVCDRPYRQCGTSQDCEHSGQQTGSTSHHYILDDSRWDLKEVAVRCYASQLSPLFESFSISWADRRQFLGTECIHLGPDTVIDQTWPTLLTAPPFGISDRGSPPRGREPWKRGQPWP